jgi:hypothetical protein
MFFTVHHKTGPKLLGPRPFPQTPARPAHMPLIELGPKLFGPRLMIHSSVTVQSH